MTFIATVFSQEIKEHSKLLHYQAIPEVHEEAVSQIQYVAEGELIITSSGSPKTSVVIMDVHRKRKAYTWKIKKVGYFLPSSKLHSLPSGRCFHSRSSKLQHQGHSHVHFIILLCYWFYTHRSLSSLLRCLSNPRYRSI